MGFTYYPRIRAVISILERCIKDTKVERYLDLGCSNGEVTKLIADHCAASEVFGVDIDNERLKIAGRRGIKVYKVDLNDHKLPYPDNYFDLITALEVIEHLLNPDNMLREVWRVLKSQGLFVITTPNLASWLNGLLLLLGFQPTYSEVSTEVLVGHIHSNSKPSGHLRLYTSRALKELLKYHGFTVIKFIGGTSTYQVPKMLRSLDELLGKLSPSLGRILLVVSMKIVSICSNTN